MYSLIFQTLLKYFAIKHLIEYDNSRAVGIQKNSKCHSYVVGISSENDPDWNDLEFLGKIIPRICQNINRVCYIAGGLVKDQVQDITPTFLSPHVLSTLRQVDSIANQVKTNKLKL